MKNQAKTKKLIISYSEYLKLRAHLLSTALPSMRSETKKIGRRQVLYFRNNDKTLPFRYSITSSRLNLKSVWLKKKRKDGMTERILFPKSYLNAIENGYAQELLISDHEMIQEFGRLFLDGKIEPAIQMEFDREIYSFYGGNLEVTMDCNFQIQSDTLKMKDNPGSPFSVLVRAKYSLQLPDNLKELKYADTSLVLKGL